MNRNDLLAAQQQVFQQQQQQKAANQPQPQVGQANMLALLQQLQQLQLQQKAATASMNTMGVTQHANIMNDLRLQQEALMTQLTAASGAGSLAKQLGQQQQQQQQKPNRYNDPTSIDPAILDAGSLASSSNQGGPSQSIWGDMPSKSG